MQRYRIANFVEKLNEARRHIVQVLDKMKSERIYSVEKIEHTYENKYELSEQISNIALASLVTALTSALDLDSTKWDTLLSWASTHSVTMEITRSRSCVLTDKKVRQVEEPTSVVVKEKESNSLKHQLAQLVSASPSRSDELVTKQVSVVRTVTDFHYDVKSKWSIRIYRGAGREPEDFMPLLQQEKEIKLTVPVDNCPFSVLPLNQRTIDLTWFLRLLKKSADDSIVATFAIDRSRKDCFTPITNHETTSVLNAIANCKYEVEMADRFVAEVCNTFSWYEKELFVPVVPFLETGENGEAKTLSSELIQELLNNQFATLTNKIGNAVELFLSPATTKEILSTKSTGLSVRQEAAYLISMKHLCAILSQWESCLMFLQNVIRNQLTAAIGKELTSADFYQFLQYFTPKLFREPYRLSPFRYAVRRDPSQSPEGHVEMIHKTTQSPLQTMTRVLNEPFVQRQIVLEAGTVIPFTGEVFVHGWLHTDFPRETSKIEMKMWANEFSSFVIVLGTMDSNTSLLPKHAFILQNRDSLSLVLWLETLPAPKEFTKAVDSLSPEQQEFARAFRAMQLESTLFAFAIIQIKPHMEQILHLEENSLIKEMKLTQDLMKLFVEYQISSEFLSYDAKERVNEHETPIRAVERHVADTNAYIEEVKAAQAKEMERLAAVTENLETAGEIGSRSQRRLESMNLEGAVAAGFTPGRIINTEVREQSLLLGTRIPAASASASSVNPYTPAGSSPACFFNELDSLGNASMEECSAPVKASRGPKICSKQVPSDGNALESLRSFANNVDDTLQEQVRMEEEEEEEEEEKEQTCSVVDVTKIPASFEKEFAHSEIVRPTKLAIDSRSWVKQTYPTIMSKTAVTKKPELDKEKNHAFELLLKLSRSGAFVLTNVSMHVFIALTHSFQKDLMDGLVENNLNPLKEVQKTMVTMNSVLHGVEPAMMVTVAPGSHA
jgi:hypothetical protein